jgi:two-component system, LytTR family, response regulator
MIKAVIIDDESYCSELLSIMLGMDCQDIEVVAICPNAIEGMATIQRLKPELVFLDVEMPKMNGFEMLEKLQGVNFHLIFTTSYDHYAVKAIRFSALDYLLKPIDREELTNAVAKVRQKMHAPLPQQLEILMEKIKQPAITLTKIALPTIDGLQLIFIDDIIRCGSDDNYSFIWLKNGKKLLVTRSLKEMEEMLEYHSFLRVHRSYIVNLNEIEKYVKGEGGYVVMSDGSSVDVARNKKEFLLKKLLPYKN